MRIVQLNLAYNRALASPQELLDSYHTLTEWARALTNAGAAVAVVQRFTKDSVTHVAEPAAANPQNGRSSHAPAERTGHDAPVRYLFVRDTHTELLPAWAVSEPCLDAVAELSPDIVHVNGLMFPAMTLALRQRLRDTCAIVLQDHSGLVPRRPFVWSRTRRRWSRAFRTTDACTFTARELATRWHDVGLPQDLTILEIPEASTTLRPMARAEAIARTQMSGDPAILWVGRVDANKDPTTVLTGLAHTVKDLPAARLCMVLPDRASWEVAATLLQDWPELRDRVTTVGPIPHREMAHYYSSADIFVSGSHHEGSGYALIEAIACGALPCVTDIPAFRVLVGGCGELWRAGDSRACAAALRVAVRRLSCEQRSLVHTHFARQLSWTAVSQQTIDAYETVLSTRRERR